MVSAFTVYVTFMSLLSLGLHNLAAPGVLTASRRMNKINVNGDLLLTRWAYIHPLLARHNSTFRLSSSGHNEVTP